MDCIRSIKKFAKDQEFDIMHSHGYKSNFYSLLGTAFLKIKRISTCHTWYSVNTKMKFYEWIDKILLKRFDKVVVVSQDLFDEVVRSGVSREKVCVINNGIDVERFNHPLSSDQHKKFKQALGINDADKVIGVVARLASDKGHEYLFQALKVVIQKMPGIKCLVVGDGPLKNHLADSVQRLGLQDNVIFTGIRKDIPELLSIMDMFVLSSTKEGMPIALLEAMAMKKPIIATNVRCCY